MERGGLMYGEKPHLWTRDLRDGSGNDMVRVVWEQVVSVEGDTFQSIGVYEDMPYLAWRAGEREVYDRVRARFDAVMAAR